MTRHRSQEQIIDDQVRIWSLQQKHRKEESDPFRPVITLSRAFGALGDALGRRVGERANFKVWDRDLVQAIARSTGGHDRIMETLDERRRRAIDDAVRGFLHGLDLTNTQYFRALVRVVRTIGEHGSAVLIGRGANYIVRPENALRIRVTAPPRWRVERYASRSGAALSDAREMVRRMDAERSDFIAHHFNSDIGEASDYDLVLNAASLDSDAFTQIVGRAYRSRFDQALFTAPAEVS